MYFKLIVKLRKETGFRMFVSNIVYKQSFKILINILGKLSLLTMSLTIYCYYDNATTIRLIIIE